MVVTLQMVFRPDGTNESFAFFYPTRLSLYAIRSMRACGWRGGGGSNHLLFCFETTMLIDGLHVQFPKPNQLVLKILQVACFRSSLLLSFSDVFVKVIQPLYNLFVGTCDNERSAETKRLHFASQT